MIKATFGITKEPFNRSDFTLLPQQEEAFELIKIHAQHGGFSVVIGQPGVGKSVLRECVEALNKTPDAVVASFSRTLHTYLKILKQLADSLTLDAPDKSLEKILIQAAFDHVRARKTIYTLIDEAHLLDIQVLRQLRLLFDRFPKKHNLVLFGQPDLLYRLSMSVNADIKGRITYSTTIKPINDDDMLAYIEKELESVRLGRNVFDDAAIEVILRSVQGNLRLCRNLCYGGLVYACREGKKVVSISHVNAVLIQPHWRSHEELITQLAS
jgi:MSHA biogenesis protein MshM